MPSFTKFLCAVNELVNIPPDFATQGFWILDRKFPTLFSLRLRVRVRYRRSRDSANWQTRLAQGGGPIGVLAFELVRVTLGLPGSRLVARAQQQPCYRTSCSAHCRDAMVTGHHHSGTCGWIRHAVPTDTVLVFGRRYRGSPEDGFKPRRLGII